MYATAGMRLTNDDHEFMCDAGHTWRVPMTELMNSRTHWLKGRPCPECAAAARAAAHVDDADRLRIEGLAE
jgi:hypothetical protein